jgi:hypothetical protein
MMFPLKVIKKSSLITLVIVTSLLVAFFSNSYAVSIFGENFNSLWSTTNPPVAPSGDTWTIAFTGDTSTNDWHRKDAFTQPWQDNPTPYACLIGGQLTGDAPDSLISPVINCSSYYNIVFRCSTFFSPLGGSYRATVWGSIDSGQTWPYVIRNFTNQNIPAQLLTDNLPWATGETRVRFLWLFEGNPAALAQWSIDDFSLTGSTVNDTDIATIRINRPRPFELPTPISIPLQATFMNVGRFTVPNIYVNCEIRNLADSTTVVTLVSDPIDSIVNGDSIVHNFSVAANLDTGMYIATVWCEASNDEDGSNDTLRRVFRVGWLEEQKYDDSLSVGDSSFVYERYGWGVKFYNHLYPDQPPFIQSVKYHFSVADTLSNKFRIRICDYLGMSRPGKPIYESGILRAVSGWNTFDISSDSIAIWDSIFYVFFIQVEGSPLSPKLSFDAERDTEAWYWVCYDSIYVQDLTTGDWMIRCVLNYDFDYPRPNANDFRTVYIGSPEENIVVRPPDQTFIPSARIENWGDLPWTNVPVVCSIISLSSPTTPYSSQLTVDLNPTDDTLLMFDPWLPDFRGLARITVRTLLLTDMDSTNDAKDETLYVHRSAFVGEDYSIYDYRWIDSDTTGGPVFSWIDTSGWYYVIAQGDDQTHSIPLIDSFGGFSFRFYDSTYNWMWVSDNGWIQFVHNAVWAPPGYPNNASLPDSLEPNNTLYAFWDDLAFGPLYGGGGIYFKKLGEAPNRKFVIIYQDVRRKNAPSSDPITFEVILHENGIITTQYKDVFCSDARYNNGRSASVGTDDSTGTYGLEYLYGEAGAGGYYPGNKINPGLAVNLYPFRKDVAIYRKIAPNKYSLPGDVTPRFRLINFGTTAITESFWSYLRIGYTYLDSVETNITLYPGDSVLLTFQPITLTLGRYALVCTTALLNDQINSNDFIAESIFVQSWAQRPDIPRSISRKRVKNGALTYFQAGKKIYALKGSNDLEFFQYDLITETWDTLTPLPDSNTQTGKRRKAKMGAALCYGDGYVYAIKGGNRQDFYAYNIIQDTWTERCTIPQQIRVGAGWVVLKKPKAGAALVYAPITGRVYLLIGNRSRFFLTYNRILNDWQLLDDIPMGYPPKKVKSGGAMTVGGDTIFALKGGSSNAFYGYICSRDTWVNLKSVPEGPSGKRIKAGAALAYYQGRVYCFKGGNTTEWWIYYQQQDTWVQGTPIPFSPQRRKKVKRGSALVTTDSLIYAFKGANTQEFWAYGPGFDSFVALPTSANGPAGEMVQKKITFGLWTYPNPAFNQVKIHYGVTQKTKIRIDVYNVLGERVKTLVNEEKPVGNYSLVWDGKADNGKQVSAGIYMAKIKQADKTKTNKLIIAK